MALTTPAMRRLAGGLVAGALLGACSPIVHERGFVPDQPRRAPLTVGESNRQSIAERLGAPTARAGFRPDTWYYIHQKIEQLAFFPQERAAQQVLVLRFDDQGKLADKRIVQQGAGRKLDHAAGATPTQGSEISLLKQLLGNLGRPGGSSAQ